MTNDEAVPCERLAAEIERIQTTLRESPLAHRPEPAAGSVRVRVVPRPAPALSARMRPPCASTSPLQIANPRPWPAVAPARPPPCLRNRCGSRSGATPRPSPETEMATCALSSPAVTRIGVDSGACCAALARRLSSTCTTRRRSTITRGQPRGQGRRGLRRSGRCFRARSTRTGTSEGSSATESVPESGILSAFDAAVSAFAPFKPSRSRSSRVSVGAGRQEQVLQVAR